MLFGQLRCGRSYRPRFSLKPFPKSGPATCTKADPELNLFAETFEKSDLIQPRSNCRE
jgi:hypothetical protein